MSEVMEQGVLRMPPHLWTGDPLDVMQRHAHYVAAADELERLRQELAAAEQERDRHFSARGRLVGERDALAADLAAARADAARYRWIRDNHEVRGRAMEIVYGMNGDDWDAAIDAALAGERREGEG